MSITRPKVAGTLRRIKSKALMSIMLMFLIFAYSISILPSSNKELSVSAKFQVVALISKALQDVNNCNILLNLHSTSQIELGLLTLPGEIVLNERHIMLTRPDIIEENKYAKLYSIKISVSNRRQVADLYYLKLRVVSADNLCHAFFEQSLENT